jgi:thiol:disulfide interchange protein DsbD
VRYLICREVCIPARARLNLALQARGTTADAPARRQLFAAARERWPEPMPSKWTAQASEERDRFILTVRTGSRETRATFFPLMQDEIDNAAPQTVTPTARGIRLALRKSELLAGHVAILKGVLVLGSRAVEISAPVSRAN